MQHRMNTKSVFSYTQAHKDLVQRLFKHVWCSVVLAQEIIRNRSAVSFSAILSLDRLRDQMKSKLTSSVTLMRVLSQPLLLLTCMVQNILNNYSRIISQ